MSEVSGTDPYSLNIGLQSPMLSPTGGRKHVLDELIDELNEIYPDKSPQAGEDFADLRWRGGQRSVVDWIVSRRAATRQTVRGEV